MFDIPLPRSAGGPIFAGLEGLDVALVTTGVLTLLGVGLAAWRAREGGVDHINAIKRGPQKILVQLSPSSTPVEAKVDVAPRAGESFTLRLPGRPPQQATCEGVQIQNLKPLYRVRLS